jgi:hypothetical protein
MSTRITSIHQRAVFDDIQANVKLCHVDQSMVAPHRRRRGAQHWACRCMVKFRKCLFSTDAEWKSLTWSEPKQAELINYDNVVEVPLRVLKIIKIGLGVASPQMGEVVEWQTWEYDDVGHKLQRNTRTTQPATDWVCQIRSAAPSSGQYFRSIFIRTV